MAQFLRDPEVLRADIIAIQEPWRNPYSDTTHHPAFGSHRQLHPTAHDADGQRAHMALYTSRKINPRTWKHTVHSADRQELELHLHGRKLRIFNIYNPGPWDTDRTDTVDLLGRVVPSRGDHIILGDFTLHHPAWSERDACDDPTSAGETTTTNDDADDTSRDRQTGTDRKAPELLEFADSRLLDLSLEPGTVTRDQNNYRSTIDLVFGAQSLANQFIACEVAPRVPADSDHLPIRTILDLAPQAYQPPKQRQWKAMDAPKLRQFVADNLSIYSHWDTLETSFSVTAVDAAAYFLIEVVQRVIQHAVSWACPSEWANPYFTPQCKRAVKITRKLRRIYIRHRLPSDWAAYVKVRNRKGRIINRSLQRGFRRWVYVDCCAMAHGSFLFLILKVKQLYERMSFTKSSSI